jgi:hypothetical protein
VEICFSQRVSVLCLTFSLISLSSVPLGSIYRRYGIKGHAVSLSAL